jgi:hypothetical protein
LGLLLEVGYSWARVYDGTTFDEQFYDGGVLRSYGEPIHDTSKALQFRLGATFSTKRQRP